VIASDRERWARLWQFARLTGELFRWHDRLVALYSERHRHYHNVCHLNECLREFDSARHLAEQPVAVELAIWFHDAIYDSHAHDNEERSADLAEECLRNAQASEELIHQVSHLVVATKHNAVPADRDLQLLVDVDLSILGQAEARFQEYESQIRQEYSWVPPELFAKKRAEILDTFLQRPRLYTTDWFFIKYEKQARVNLEKSLAALRA
jgi:predicted metal-dependent HD superfamily phosphohydrolase